MGSLIALLVLLALVPFHICHDNSFCKCAVGLVLDAMPSIRDVYLDIELAYFQRNLFSYKRDHSAHHLKKPSLSCTC
jgi:hypothetical protein